MSSPVRQCAAVRRQCASALVKVSAPVRQCAYRAHTGAHTAPQNHKDSDSVRRLAHTPGLRQGDAS